MEGTVFFLPLELSCVVGKSHSMRLKCSVVVECAWPGQQQSRAARAAQGQECEAEVYGPEVLPVGG